MKNPRALAFVPFTLLALLTVTPVARGGFVTGTITGEVTASGGAVKGIAVGSLVSGSYSYDDSIETHGLFGAVNPLTSLSFSIGTNPRSFDLSDLSPGTLFQPVRVLSFSKPAGDSVFFLFNTSAISEFAGAAVTSLIVDYSPRKETITVGSDAAHSFSFNLSFNVTPTVAPTPTVAVPEPSSFAMIGLGCVAMAGYARRSRTRSLA